MTTAVLAHTSIRPHQHYAARTTTSEKDSTEIVGEEEMDMLKNWNDWMAPLPSDSDDD